MAILDIDTDLLRQCVNTARQSNEAITDACNLLNQVVVHNDWQCQERWKINENTVSNRQEAQRIQQNSSAFYQAIAQSSARFDEAEQSTISHVSQVESLLAQIMTVVPGIGGGVGAAISSFSDIKNGMEG